MANSIRLKRRASGGAAGAPSSLWAGEPAYSEVDQILYIGEGTGGAGGTATTIRAISGPGAFISITGSNTTAGSNAISGNKDFTGTVSFGASTTGVTAATNDNTTKLATTAFVLGQGNSTAGTIAMNGTQAAGTSNLYARADHVHPTDTSRAALASPTFTGTPAAPTAAVDTNTTQIATTAFVLGQAASATPAALGSAAVGTSTRYARADHVHANPTLSSVGAATADISLGGFKITNLATPVASTDAATKGYCDSLSTGLDVKASCRAASTANVTVTYTATGGTSARGQITAAPNTLDGVTLAANDRILLKNQTTGAQNGIYVVSTVGTGSNGVWDRATDFDTDAEVTAGAFTFVEEGTANADSGWVLTTNNPIVIGGASGTALTFTQFSSAGAYVAGAGLTLTGSTFDVVGTSNRISVAADSIDIAATYVGQTSITTLGTIGTGTWNGALIGATYGGTGVNNGSNTITIGGNVSTAGALTFSGAFGTTFTVTGTTSLTLPTSGTVLSDGSTVDGGVF